MQARIQHRNRGFTLIELLVVVVILGIVAGLGLPSFLETIARNRVVAQHNELMAGLAFARSEAIRRNSTVSMCAANAAQSACQATWGQNWLVWDDINADGSVDAGEDILQVGGAANTEQLSASSATHTVFRFSARGLRELPAGATWIRVRAVNCPTGRQRMSRRITVLPTGATNSIQEACP